ncbi:MAG: hypothetical protein ACXQS8_00645 [Candidatus Helarchaeales archaeon]
MSLRQYYSNPFGLRLAVASLGQAHPHFTTLHGWLSGLGERSFDRIQSISRKAGYFSSGISHDLIPTSALIAETSKRLNPELGEFWNQSVDSIENFKYLSEKRLGQLQGTLRILNSADFIFPNTTFSLAGWEKFLCSNFHVMGWGFPSRFDCTAIQLPPSIQNRIGSQFKDFLTQKGERNGHDPP